MELQRFLLCGISFFVLLVPPKRKKTQIQFKNTFAGTPLSVISHFLNALSRNLTLIFPDAETHFSLN